MTPRAYRRTSWMNPATSQNPDSMKARTRARQHASCAFVMLHVLLLSAPPGAVAAQTTAAARAAPEAGKCAAIVGSLTGSARQCTEWLGELADIESVLNAEQTPDHITLAVINERNACRSRGRDPLVDDYLAARNAFIRHSESVRLKDDAENARVAALFRAAQAICAAEEARAIASALATWVMPSGASSLCSKAMASYQAAMQIALAAQEARDPAVDAAADKVVAAGERLQAAWQSRTVELKTLAARDACVR